MRKILINYFKPLFFGALFTLAFAACEEEETAGADPTADFTYETDESDPLTVTFAAAVEHASGVSWNFGDGSEPSVDENPVHTFADGGDYQVTLTAIGEAGNAEVTKIVSVVAPPAAPEAAFNYVVDEENPLMAVFTNTSLHAETYEWDFGDETGTSSEADPSYVYAAAGTYQVTLTATGEGGANSVTRDITVGEPGGGDPVNLLQGSEMNAEDADKWSVKNYRANEFEIEFNGKLQLNLQENQPPNTIIYQVVDLEPGTYELNAHISGTGITNAWIEFNAIPGSEIPASDPGGTHKLMGWTFWCGREDGAATADVDGYIVDVYCEGDNETLEVAEADSYIIAVKVGFSNSGSALATPILIDDFTLTPVSE